MDSNVPLLILCNSAISGICLFSMLPLEGSRTVLLEWVFNVKAMDEKVRHDDQTKAEEGSLIIRLQRKEAGPRSEKRKCQNEMLPMRIPLRHNQTRN